MISLETVSKISVELRYVHTGNIIKKYASKYASCKVNVIFTVRNGVAGKVMFSQASVILFTRGVVTNTPRQTHTPWQTPHWADTPWADTPSPGYHPFNWPCQAIFLSTQMY